MKFGVREICDVVLRAKSNQWIGKKYFYQNEPVIYFDTLKTSSMEGAATTVYAQGGRGNARLVAWEGERTVTFTMEDALISPEGFSILTGAGLIEASESKPVYVHTTEIVKYTKDSNKVTAVLKGTPCFDAKCNIYVFPMKDGEIFTEPYTIGIEQGDTENTIIIPKVSGNIEINDISKFNGEVCLVDYYIKKQSAAMQIDITPDQFGGFYYLEASTLFRNEEGRDMPAEFIIPKCKIQSNFTFTMASSGDPSTFTFTMDAFPDYTRFDKTKKVFAAVQVITDQDGQAEEVRTKTNHDYVKPPSYSLIFSGEKGFYGGGDASTDAASFFWDGDQQKSLTQLSYTVEENQHINNIISSIKDEYKNPILANYTCTGYATSLDETSVDLYYDMEENTWYINYDSDQEESYSGNEFVWQEKYGNVVLYPWFTKSSSITGKEIQKYNNLYLSTPLVTRKSNVSVVSYDRKRIFHESKGQTLREATGIDSLEKLCNILSVDTEIPLGERERASYNITVNIKFVTSTGVDIYNDEGIKYVPYPAENNIIITSQDEFQEFLNTYFNYFFNQNEPNSFYPNYSQMVWLTFTWNDVYTLSFDANGGEFEEGTEVEKYRIKQDESYRNATGWSSIKEPTKEGYQFNGWKYNDYELTDLDDIYGLTTDATFTAEWIENN